MTKNFEERFSTHDEHLGYLVGRLQGLAGTIRYDLSDEDREVLKDAASLLELLTTRTPQPS